MFLLTNMNQHEKFCVILTGFTWSWEQHRACTPDGTCLLSPAPLTACGVALGASRLSCVSTSLPASLQTVAGTGTAWKGSATARGTSGEAQPVTSWTVALPTAACMASAPTVSYCAARGGARGCPWVAPSMPGLCICGNITHLPTKHHDGASACHDVQSCLVRGVISQPELTPAAAASLTAESSALWRGLQPWVLMGANGLASPGSRRCCGLSPWLTSWCPFPPASEAAVETVTTRCL